MTYFDIDQNFFGCKNTLSLLKKRVRDLKEGYRQNIAFLGNRYVGKTTILQDFLYNLDDNEVTPIYFDLDNKDFSYFFHKFCASILYHYLKNKNLTRHDELPLLMEQSKKYIPQTIEVIHNIQSHVAKGKMVNAFQGLMTLPEIYSNESGQFCVLIFDEFQALEEFDISPLFSDLGNKIMTQKKCLYILSSSYKQRAHKIISEKLSLLFGNFEMVELEAFDFETSQQFIDHLLDGHKIGMHLSSFLIDFTGGYPLYLSLICRELINLRSVHRQDEIYMPLVTQSVENTIFDRWGVISRHFELIVNDLCNGKGNRVYSSILMALANGKQKTDDILNCVEIKKSQLTQKLNRLQDEGLIVKNGRLHYFKDKLFRYWIKFVYQKRLNGIELMPDKQRKQFRDEFNLYVERFKLSTRMDFSSRIVELLNCFDNEALDLNGRKYRVPTFRDIIPGKLTDDHGFHIDFIKASTDSAEWLIVLKKESFVENDISAIVGEAKKFQRKPEKCLMISLSKLDDHTKLKALQERFWIWNEEELNVLLTLFDKPYIVR